MSDADKKKVLIISAMVLLLWIALSWWRSGELNTAKDIQDVSAQMAQNVRDIVSKAKQEEGKIHDKQIQEVEALPGNDVASGLDALLRGYRAGR